MDVIEHITPTQRYAFYVEWMRLLGHDTLARGYSA